jgi:hydroxymethylbilane synthase
LRSDLVLSEVRGNVQTRLRKLDEGQYDALVLATAGLTRLGLGSRISCELAPPEMFPAVSQGAVGVECRTDDEFVRLRLGQITDRATLAAVTAERSLLHTLRAGCHAPLGVSATAQGENIQLEAVVLPLDGSCRWMACAAASEKEAAALGIQVAQLLLAQGVDRVLRGPS